jgi:hypothetical protein
MRRCLLLLCLVTAQACGEHVDSTLSAAVTASPIPWTSAPPRSWPVATLASQPMPKQMRSCRAEDVVAEQLIGQGAGGRWTGGLRLLAAGAPCLVWGYVDVRFKDGAGVQIARAAEARATVSQDWALLGEARVFWWVSNWCARDMRVASIEAVLPSDRVPIVIPVDPPMTVGGRCDAPGSPHVFSVAPIEPTPTSVPTIAAPPVTNLGARISVRSTVTAGTRLRYVVTLTNLTTSVVSLDPCPSYLAWLGGHPLPTSSPPPNIGSKPWEPTRVYAGIVKASHQLNCAVDSIAPLGVLTFEMFIDVPTDAVGADTLSWALVGGMPNANASITIVPR